MTHATVAERTAMRKPHLTSHAVVRTNHVAVRTALARARYAARRVMRGGMIFCASQSDGLDVIRAEPRPISALKNAMPCARSVRSALSTGGGRQEVMYESRGSRRDGTGIGISGGTTIGIVGGGEGRWMVVI
jgi:hypothetical protein